MTLLTKLRCRVYLSCIIPRLHDRANVEQTSSKHRANIKQTLSRHRANVEQTSSRLVQLTYSQLVEPAWSCKWGITEGLAGCWTYCSLQVMQTKNMLYLVSEYAPHGEIFGMCILFSSMSLILTCILLFFCYNLHFWWFDGFSFSHLYYSYRTKKKKILVLPCFHKVPVNIRCNIGLARLNCTYQVMPLSRAITRHSNMAHELSYLFCLLWFLHNCYMPR